MLQSIDTCQNKESADQYHVTISRAQVQGSSRSRVFLKLTAAQVLLFSIRSRAHVRINLLYYMANSASGQDESNPAL